MSEGGAKTESPQRRLSIDYLLNPAARPLSSEDVRSLDAKGCVVKKGSGLRPPLRPKNWDKKGATYPLPSWNSPPLAPILPGSKQEGQTIHRGSLPGIATLATSFPRRLAADDAATAAQEDPSTPSQDNPPRDQKRLSGEGNKDELNYLDTSTLDSYYIDGTPIFTGSTPEALTPKIDQRRRERGSLGSSGSSTVYSPFSSPFSSPCPSPASYSSPCPSPTFPTPVHSSPSSSPLPFLTRSASSPSFGNVIFVNNSSQTLPSPGSESTPSSSSHPSPPSGAASPYPLRASSPSIFLSRALDCPSPGPSPLRPAGSFPQFSHSAFSPVSSSRRRSSADTPPPTLSEQKSPGTKKRLNEEMQTSNLSSAFENWSLESSDEKEDSGSRSDSPSARNHKKKKSNTPVNAAATHPNKPTSRAPAAGKRLAKSAGAEKEEDLEEDEEFPEEDSDESRRRRATPEQVHILEQVFEMNPLPTAATKKELAKRIGMSHRQIQVKISPSLFVYFYLDKIMTYNF